MLVAESKEILKRELYIKTLIENIYPCIGDFIDYLINNFYYIKNNDIYNIIFTYKNNKFIYKNVNNFINFSKLVMQKTINIDSLYIIDYTNFYIDLCFEYKHNNYLKKISNKLFIENLLYTAHLISKDEHFIYIYLSNICKCVIMQSNQIINKLNLDILKKFIFIILNNFKYF